MPMIIRKCQINDLVSLREVCIETYYDTFKSNTTEENLKLYFDTAYQLETLESELLNPHSEVYLLESESIIAGYLKINIEDAQTEPMGNETLEVQRIYVRSAFKRRGFGNKLLLLAEKRARELDKKRIWLGVWEKNFKAQAFYESNGYHHVGEHQFIAGDQIDIDWIMQKKLDEIN